MELILGALTLISSTLVVADKRSGAFHKEDSLPGAGKCSAGQHNKVDLLLRAEWRLAARNETIQRRQRGESYLYSRPEKREEHTNHFDTFDSIRLRQ